MRYWDSSSTSPVARPLTIVAPLVRSFTSLNETTTPPRSIPPALPDSSASTIPEYCPSGCSRRSRTAKRDGASTPTLGPPGTWNSPAVRSTARVAAEIVGLEGAAGT